MQISKEGICLIKKFEGCELEAYQDAVGVWTIGYGHTKNVQEGQKISVIITGFDKKGREQLSMKALAKKEAEVAKARPKAAFSSLVLTSI